MIQKCEAHLNSEHIYFELKCKEIWSQNIDKSKSLDIVSANPLPVILYKLCKAWSCGK